MLTDTIATMEIVHCEGIQQGRQRVELRINITRADWAISILMTFGPVGF